RLAFRCLLFARLQESETRRQEWQRQIEAAQERQTEIGRRREEITKGLRECDRLRQLLRALETDLPLRASAWREAETLLSQAMERVKQLQTLAESLPERNRQRD